MQSEAGKKKISIVSSCYNEEQNLGELHDRLCRVISQFPYDYEIIIADNCSTDNSRQVLREIAAKDKNFKVIFNANNFGHIRSPYNAFMQATGDAVVMMCSDLQEPPEMIAEFIKKWEQGYDVVVGVRSGTKASFMLECLRKLYYRFLGKLSQTGEVIQAFTGFGLYSRKFMDGLRQFHEPYPYFRGLVSEIGFKRAEVPFVQDKRKHGKTKNNYFTLYDMAMTGVVNHSKLPLRLAVFCGFILAVASMLIALGYLVYKLMFWDTFTLGLAPLVIGLFFFSAIQLIFIGIIGEYLGAVWTQVKDRPWVIEEEKINFDRQGEK